MCQRGSYNHREVSFVGRERDGARHGRANAVSALRESGAREERNQSEQSHIGISVALFGRGMSPGVQSVNTPKVTESWNVYRMVPLAVANEPKSKPEDKPVSGSRTLVNEPLRITLLDPSVVLARSEMVLIAPSRSPLAKASDCALLRASLSSREERSAALYRLPGGWRLMKRCIQGS